MAKKFNVRDVLKAHSMYKCGLLKTYKLLAEQNKKNIELMKLIKPMLEKSEIEEI